MKRTSNKLLFLLLLLPFTISAQQRKSHRFMQKTGWQLPVSLLQQQRFYHFSKGGTL
jgi:branched-subunit amino acid transport protein AzlD